MAAPRLPRELLWNDKRTMDEFMEIPLCRELYKAYREMDEYPMLFKMDELQVFNEVYFEMTRLCFENWYDSYSDFDFYVREVYADMVTNDSVMTVFSLMYAIVIVVNFPPLNIDKRRIKELKKYQESGWGKGYIDKFIRHVMEEGLMFDDRFEPSPCPPSMLSEKYIDWFQVTDGFNPGSIDSMLSLWKDKEDRLAVASIVDDEMQRYKKSSRSKKVQAEMAFARIELERTINIEKGDLEAMALDGGPFSEIAKWEVKYNKLEKRYSQLESEKIKLEEQVKKRKNTPQNKLRLFTLDEIVNYAENNLDLQCSMPIQALLHNLLSKDGTEEEREKVNSIPTYIIKRQVLDFRGSKVSMSNPQFHGSLYEIKDNDTVNLGDNNNGKEE